MCLFLVLFCISPTGRNYPMYLTVNMFSTINYPRKTIEIKNLMNK